MKKWFLFCFIYLISAAHAQDEILQTQRMGYLQIGSYFQGWKIEGQIVPINQISVPLVLALPLGTNMHLILTHKPAYTWWEDQIKISGPSDTWVQMNYMLVRNAVLVNLGVGVPTGKTRLNNDQLLMTQLLSKNIFRFSLPVYGQGLCLKGGIAGAYPISDRVILGMGAQYIKKGSYYPVDYTYTYLVGNELYSETYSPEYQAGDEISGQVGLDIAVSQDVKVMVDLMMTHYGRDMLDGVETYGSGQKLMVEGGVFYRFPDEKYIWGHILYRRKGKSEIRQGLDFESEEYNSSGNQFDVDIHADLTSAENAKFALLFNGRFYGENEYGVGKANIAGAGVGMHYEASPTTDFDFHLKYLTGSTDDRSIEGMEIYMAIKFEF